MNSVRFALAAIFAALAIAPAGCNREHKVTVKETVEEPPEATGISMVIKLDGPQQAKQLVNGFYAIESGAWRWTAKDFTATLRPPAGAAAQGATLVFALSVPQATVDKLKSVTLSAFVHRPTAPAPPICPSSTSMYAFPSSATRIRVPANSARSVCHWFFATGASTYLIVMRRPFCV